MHKYVWVHNIYIIDMKVNCIILQHSILYRCEILLFFFGFFRFKKKTNMYPSIPLQKTIFCLSKLKVFEIPEHCTQRILYTSFILYVTYRFVQTTQGSASSITPESNPHCLKGKFLSWKHTYKKHYTKWASCIYVFRNTNVQTYMCVT